MNLTTWATEIKSQLRRFIFPLECVACSRSDTWLCQECFEKIAIRPHQEKNYLRQQDYIDKIYIASYYSDKSLQKIIDLYKYHYQENLAIILTNLLIKFIKTNRLTQTFNQISLLALPLHHRRFLERGFNQSQLLAGGLAKKFNWPVINNNLIRTHYTKHQTLLNHENRKKNISNAFTVSNQTAIIGQRILLIDDVVTTGASLNEAARVLRLAGAVKIWGLVLAKN